jgi:hypothetical protein
VALAQRSPPHFFKLQPGQFEIKRRHRRRTVPKTAFQPAQHGFHFANYFVNVIADVPGVGRLQTGGRCGGMAFCALDHFFFNQNVPAFTGADFAPALVPPDTHPLAQYIYQRQLDSFLTLTAPKFVVWTLAPDKPNFFSKGLRRRTREDEFQKLKQAIDRGMPVTLGLIVARDLSGLGRNHQVVAYGYEDEAGTLTVHIYDVNWPAQELTLTAGPDDAMWLESSAGNEQWRGWFVQDYAPRRPPDGLAEPLAGTPKVLEPDEALDSVTVRLRRLSFVHPEQPALQAPMALVFAIGGKPVRWPAKGTRPAKHGKKALLRRAIKLKLKASEPLVITGRPAFDEVQGDLSDLDYFALAPESRPGSFVQRFTANENWGRGAHRINSAGSAGAYTLDFEIE